MFDQDLGFKFTLLALISFKKEAISIFILNFYAKLCIFLRIKKKFKFFHIKKISKTNFEINTEIGIVNTPTVSRCLMLSGGFEHRINKLIEDYGINYFISVFKKKNPVVLDIGANIGEFSIYCAKRNSKVFAIEHDKFAFECLQLNLERFCKNNTVPFNMSISNKTDKQKIFYRTSTGSTSLIQPLIGKEEGFNRKLKTDQFSAMDKYWDWTNSITLDDFIDKNEIEFVDLIKCDAEGAEPEIIEGLKKNSHKVGYISLDTGPERNGKTTTEEVIKLCQERNFDIIEIGKGSRGLVIAKNKRYV
jgi:FkbM family methyltransferase